MRTKKSGGQWERTTPRPPLAPVPHPPAVSSPVQRGSSVLPGCGNPAAPDRPAPRTRLHPPPACRLQRPTRFQSSAREWCRRPDGIAICYCARHPTIRAPPPEPNSTLPRCQRGTDRSVRRSPGRAGFSSTMSTRKGPISSRIVAPAVMPSSTMTLRDVSMRSSLADAHPIARDCSRHVRSRRRTAGSPGCHRTRRRHVAARGA